MPESSCGASSPSPGKPLSPDDHDILIITLRTGFPSGMAATRRVLLIARALQEGGANPAVIHMNTSETSEPFRNHEVCGIYDGIPFEYACGRVDRPRSFLARRVRTFLGFLRTCRLVAEGAASGRLRAVLFYERSIFSLLPILMLCREQGINFALDLVEWPVAMEANQGALGRLSLRLYRKVALPMADRITAISRFLLDRSREIRRSAETVMYLPVLAAPDGLPAERRPVPGRLVLSISGGYSRELTLVLEAFSLVVESHPEAELHITGGLDEMNLSRIVGTGAEAATVSPEALKRVRCRGYLPRDELLNLFSTGCAAVAALEDDLRSLSRMPTKIAEYTFSGLPLVAGSIGDVTETFVDGLTAFMYSPGDRDSLAGAMLRVLEDPERAEAVGIAGKRLALATFSYGNYSAELKPFLLNEGEPC